MTTPTPPTPPTFSNSKEAKAQAKATKAHAKALRPWFKKKRWIISIGFVLLVIIAGVAGSSSDTTDNGGSASSSSSSSSNDSGGGSDEKDDETTGTVGEPVTNAGMTYEVTSARSASTIGDTTYGLGAEADGEFVIVNLELTNNKDDTKTFSETAAKVVTTDGKEYETTSDAVLAFGDDGLFLKEVQPDLTTSGKIAFDLPPAKVSGSKLVIEDLYGRGEVTIDLGL